VQYGATAHCRVAALCKELATTKQQHFMCKCLIVLARKLNVRSLCTTNLVWWQLAAPAPEGAVPLKLYENKWEDWVASAHRQQTNIKVVGRKTTFLRTCGGMAINIIGLIFTAVHENYIFCLSVCPSVCLSNAWIVTNRKKSVQIFVPYER